MSMTNLPDHVLQNRAEWDRKAPDFARYAVRAWAQQDITWGQLEIPEVEVQALPADLDGMDVVELGCGTAYFSAWLARRGANPVGIDISPKQVETARAMQADHDLHFPIHLGNAEDLPFEDASFELALSEYGASIWCDPYAWIPEAARVLRPGGRLVFLVNGLLSLLCSGPDDLIDTPLGTCLQRPLLGMHRLEWNDEDSVEFHLPHGEMIRVLREAGFEIERLIELPDPAGKGIAMPLIPPDWTSQWPAEEIWVARKR